MVSRVEKREDSRLLRTALGTLPEDQGRAVVLRYFEGLSLKATAERLERSEAAVKALVARGLGALGRTMRKS